MPASSPVSQVIDRSLFCDDDRWTVFKSEGSTYLFDRNRFFTRPNESAAFGGLGLLRSRITGAVNRVYQIDFLLTDSKSNVTNIIFGLRNDGQFSVSPTIIYGFINATSGAPVRVQTFPSGATRDITPGEIYRLKLRTITDNVEVYIHGGCEKYNNELIGTGPFAGIHAGNVYSVLDVAGLKLGSSIRVRNYYVTDDLNFEPPEHAATLTNQDWDTKSWFSR